MTLDEYKKKLKNKSTTPQNTPTNSNVSKSLNAYKQKFVPPPPKIENKFGSDVSNHAFNPLNPNNQLNKAPVEDKPSIWQSIKNVIRPGNIKTTAQSVVNDIKNNPAEVATAIPIGLFDAGSKILNNTAKAGSSAIATLVKPIIGDTYSKTAKLPVFSEQLKNFTKLDSVKKYGIYGDQTESDTAKALRESATNVSGFYMGNALAKPLGFNKLGTEIAGNVIGGQLTSDATNIKDRAKQAGLDATFAIATEGLGSGLNKILSTFKGVSKTVELSKLAANSLENDLSGVKKGSIDYAKQQIKEGVMPPVNVRTLDDGRIWIEDGRHRLEAAKQLGVDYPVQDVTDLYKPKTEVKPEPNLAPIESTGEKITSGLAKNVEARAVEKDLVKDLGDLPEYSKVNMKDQADMAKSLLDTDPEYAKRIALGKEAPPVDVIPESVFKTVEKDALAKGDIETLRELANSSLTGEATVMGQRIRALADNTDSVVGKMNKVIKAREAAVLKKYGAKAKVNIRNAIKTEIKKAAPKPKDWASFVESLKCN